MAWAGLWMWHLMPGRHAAIFAPRFAAEVVPPLYQAASDLWPCSTHIPCCDDSIVLQKNCTHPSNRRCVMSALNRWLAALRSPGSIGSATARSSHVLKGRDETWVRGSTEQV